MSSNESENGENEQWDVEEIVGRRVKKGRTEYFVKWTGYNEGKINQSNDNPDVLKPHFFTLLCRGQYMGTS